MLAGGPGGDRTHDLRIKSPLLCQLSYRPTGNGSGARFHPSPPTVSGVSAGDAGHVVVEGFASADFEQFYAEHHGTLTRALVLSLRRDRLAREASRQAFGRALHHWEALHTHRHPEGWVFRVALDWAGRRARHHPPLERPTAAPPSHPGFDGALDRALGRMDLNGRTMLVLRHYLAWPPADVAAAMRLPRLVVGWRLRATQRALARDAMVDAAEVATRIAWHLTAAASAMEMTKPDVQAISHPAGRRRRWVVTAVVAALALVLATVALVAGSRQPAPAPSTTIPGLVVEEPPDG